MFGEESVRFLLRVSVSGCRYEEIRWELYQYL
jgi:hypothetical protein